MSTARRKLLATLFRDGTPVEAGFASFRDWAAPPNISQRQVDDMRNVFFAGALHVWCMVGECALEADANDRKYQAINDELRAFAKRMIADANKRSNT